MRFAIWNILILNEFYYNLDYNIEISMKKVQETRTFQETWNVQECQTRWRISRKVEGGYKLIARKGKSYQEIYVIGIIEKELLEELIR